MKKFLSIAVLFAAVNSLLNAGPRDWSFRKIAFGTAVTTGTYFSVRAALNPEAGTKEKIAYGAVALASTYGAIRYFKGAFSKSAVKRVNSDLESHEEVAQIREPAQKPVVKRDAHQATYVSSNNDKPELQPGHGARRF